MSSEGRKLNCWDFKKCGREPDGENIAECGVCPAATEGGDNGGRACWVVAGTSCKGGAEGKEIQSLQHVRFLPARQR